MKITKYGHCCLLIEEGGAKVLTDPGTFTADGHAELIGIDVILYTHEHADHYHLDSLRQLLVTNPSVTIICNEGVSTLLEDAGIVHLKMTDGESEQKGIAIRGISGIHEEIHSSIPRIQNTGFFIANKLWYPGDAFIRPHVAVEVLALPVAGPWMKLSEAVDYAIALKPKTAFPVHDMILHPQFAGFVPVMVANLLQPHGIEFRAIELKKEYDF
jgi:L-ascorbate metabolism protein UlaG (beta-lactamase superfamily)